MHLGMSLLLAPRIRRMYLFQGILSIFAWFLVQLLDRRGTGLKYRGIYIVLFVTGLLGRWSTPGAQSNDIQGFSRMKLTGPVSRELSKEARRVAVQSMAGPLLDWINSHTDIPWDTSNAIYRYHFHNLLSKCAEKATENSEFEGYLWTYTLTVKNADRHSVVVRHNARFDSLAFSYWEQSQAALKKENISDAYRSAVAALFFSMGHIGAPPQVPDSPESLLRVSRSVLQDMLSRLKLSTDHMVIEGKPGFLPKKAVRISVRIDDTPLAQFPVNGLGSGGRKIFSAETEHEGSISLEKVPVPYVANGSFLYIVPSFEGIVDVRIPFNADDLGLKVTKAQKEQVIYKLIPPVYTLKYGVNEVSDIEVPSDFSRDTFLRRFFSDTCFLDPHDGSEEPDLAFDIHSQVSKYTNDQTYQLVIKVDSRIIIQPKKHQHDQVEKAFTLLERTYDLEEDISLGLFFWEAAAELKKNIRRILMDL